MPEPNVEPNTERNVVLTGFMGTGKSTVGRILADRLGRELVDTDAVVEERHGPIPAIFAERGEAAFREIERALAVELAARSGLVVSTGGRMLVDPDSADALSATGDVFCLTASTDTIVARLLADGVATRPMLAGVDDLRARVEALVLERAPAYARFTQVATDALAPADVAATLLAALQTQ